ncbi:hypothetical protein ILUMI_21198 [Ignelater luminosus]|uniref:Carboxylic ester hydrolase n=1 Tax=Ignelater luminosus TaxID=2038154 RepID=A0A8K0CJA5_IGNLU|nr:hypothetical protein ILUMI_21198 [Ignelater luminosus]
MWINYCIFICICDLIVCQSLTKDRRPTVRIAQGVVTGIKVYADSGGVADAFLGLPYAAAPIGKLRFAAPQRHGGWNGTFQASEYGPSCPQLPPKEGINESEDCLFLNIWAPEITSRYPLPVVIFFDGEEFTKGNRIPIPGQDLATEEVVVVTINYRLNVFGFLCFENQDVRGNMGLLDQYFAMLWVRENIRYFGGDPDKVTLYGHSAGAASVALHMISPRTAGFFQRTIISSGAATSPWHFTTNAKSASFEIVRVLGCLSSYLPSILQCLRSRSTQDLLKAYEEYQQSGNYSSMLLPVMDIFLPENDRYLPTMPETAFKSGTYMQVPILTGITKPISFPQYALWMKLASQGYTQLQQFAELSKIPEIMKRYSLNGRFKKQISDFIDWRYIEPSNGDVRILLEQLKRLEFESKIEAPHFLQIQYLLSSYIQPIYVYYLENPGIMLNAMDSPLTPDLLLLFGPLLLNQIVRRRFNNRELRLSQHIKQLWKNFIIFGNPTPSNQIKTWYRYNSVENHIEYLGTDSQTSSEDTIQRSRRINFWNQLLPKLAAFTFDEQNGITRELQNTYVPGAGYRHAMYTLSGLVVALLALLLVCIVLIKKRAKERERQFQMVY